MTKDKIKLKDLAEDLKIPRQELLGTAREMNLAVRSVQGSVTPEEADKLRRHYEKIRQADKDQKQVIVRHRRNAAPADGAGAKPAPRERAADGGRPQRAP
ncbi:MAG: translation initiation factor IF-2 N-terminal domain-containing protein, partial [Desulfovibrio sp.]|nr:translation initiation factor IF-2 N-terminal domain-containing protein [Desulfovibrio sp.]